VDCFLHDLTKITTRMVLRWSFQVGNFFQSQKSDWSISTSQFVVNFWLHQAVNVVLYRWSRTSSRRLNKIFHELLNIRSCDVENLVLHSIARHSQPVSESHHILLTLPIYPTTT